MTREISYYEFVGLLVPSVILLFFTNYLINFHCGIQFFNYETIGESLIFLILAYGVGHFLHALGNIFEKLVWWSTNGRPTNWLTRKQRFYKDLFDKKDTQECKDLIDKDFALIEGKDYGSLIYIKLFDLKKTERIDLFNANYSLYRSLCIALLILTIEAIVFGNKIAIIISALLFILALLRMIRFGKYYALELYRTYINSSKKVTP